MRLSFVTSNILHQVLYHSETNIVYYPSNSLFDEILYFAFPEYNFFVFDENYASEQKNCLGIPTEYIDLYSYDLIIHNSILDLSRQPISHTLHSNAIILQHQNVNPKIKKEDKIILNNKTDKYEKIFFNQIKSLQWKQEKYTLMEYGIPQEIFNYKTQYKDREKNILIIGSPNNIAAQQMQSFFKKQYNNVDIIDNTYYKNFTLTEINNHINQYKTIINLSDNDYMDLVGIACGCNVLSISSSLRNAPALYPCESAQEIVEKIDIVHDPDYDLVTNYLNQNHNFSLFKLKLSQIINAKAKQEAYTL